MTIPVSEYSIILDSRGGMQQVEGNVSDPVKYIHIRIGLSVRINAEISETTKATMLGFGM